MLTIESLTYSPAGTPVLDHLDLQLNDREMVTLLGPSGSGKTTLLRMVSGLEVPDAGRITLDEDVLTDGGVLAVPPAKRPFAFLFQDFTLFPHLTVRQNIELGIRKLPKPERRERVNGLADLLGIAPLLKRRIDRLSGGEQQRVALARTLALRPRLLLLDEPFSNLDPMTQQRLSRDVKQIALELGIAVLLASHNREEAFFFSDRLVVLSEGRKCAEGLPADLYRHPETEWMATFTGETVLCSPDQLQRRFGTEADSDADLFLVRPEDIGFRCVDAGSEKRAAPVPGAEDAHRMAAARCTCTVSGVEFYGTTSKVFVTDSDGEAFHLTVLGPTEVQPGDSVSLHLARNPVAIRR